MVFIKSKQISKMIFYMKKVKTTNIKVIIKWEIIILISLKIIHITSQS